MKKNCKYPDKVKTLTLDLTRPEESAVAIKAYLGTIGFVIKHIDHTKTLDILVLNAGISQRDIFERTNYETAKRIMDINFMSNVAIIRVSKGNSSL